MDKTIKFLALSGAGVMGIAAMMLAVKATRNGHHITGMCENAGKGLDERLKDPMAALDKATAHIQSVLEHLKKLKS